VAVLKRLADAERDGDRIYAVIKGVGASSDGRDKGLTAPRAEGQLRALRRAYAQARVSPARVGLVEAHGTGTVVGDHTEARAIGQLFREAGGRPQSCAIGSVKSMIGHSKCAAGLAGLIKAAFALHHKVLPPTLVEVPNPKANLDGGPLYLNTDARPWVHGAKHPRTAGVSAFGFGGTNFHTVLEEYTGDYLNRPESGLRHWPAELLVWRRPDVNGLLADVKRCRDALAAGAAPELPDLAASVWQTSKLVAPGAPLLAVVAMSLDDLKEKLDAAVELVNRDRQGAGANAPIADPRGICFAATPQAAARKVAFLFPGQGSQYPDMLSQVAIAFPEVREALDQAEQALLDRLEKPLGKFIYPPSPFTPEQEAANRKALQQTEVAQPAVGAASLGMFRLLTALGIEPDFLAGHSYGEYAALAAAGALSEDDLIRLSHRRGLVIREAAASSPGGMIAADAAPAAIEPVLKGIAGAWVANHNAPNQTVIAGTEDGLKAAAEKLQAAGIRAQRIPVACGFHSPLIAGAREPLAAALAEVRFAPPRKPVYSNTTAAPHAADPAAIARQLAEHLVSPVKFADEITAMYEAGARVFVEVGPQAVLTGLAAQVLAGKPHLAVASDQKARPGLVQLAHLLGQLLAAGVPAKLDRLFQGRGVQPLDLTKLGPDTGKPKPAPTAWVVNGVRSRPVNGPEPRLLGQALPTRPEVRDQKTEVRKQQPTGAASLTSDLRPLTSGEAPTAAAVTPYPVPSPSTPPRVTMNNPDTTAPLAAPSANGQHHPQPVPDGAAAVMMRFQEVMARFLDTQRSVMLSFLGANGTATHSANGHAAYPLNGSGHAPPAAPGRQPARRAGAGRPPGSPAGPVGQRPANAGHLAGSQRQARGPHPSWPPRPKPHRSTAPRCRLASSTWSASEPVTRRRR
jgi:acyl transferase domain-containing protein